MTTAQEAAVVTATSDEVRQRIELEKRQQELESLGFEEGRKRFREQHEKALREGAGSRALAIRKFFTEGVDRLEEALVFFVKQYEGKRGRPHHLVRWVQELSPATVAYITLVDLFDGIAQRRIFRTSANDLAIRLEDEARYRKFEKEAPELFQYRQKKLKRTSSVRHKKAALNQSMQWAKVEDEELRMSPAERLYVGVKLIELAVNATGLFEIKTIKGMGRAGVMAVVKDGKGELHSVKRKGFTTDKYLIASPEGMDWISKRTELLELLFPIAGPMVVPPKPWAPGGIRGGYKYQLRGKYPLVRRVSRHTQAECTDRATTVVYSALNALQETRWQVNRKVLAVVEELWLAGRGRAGLPTALQPPQPLNSGSYAALPQDEQRKVRAQRAKAMEEYRLSQGQVSKMAGTITAAKRVQNMPAIYFPYSLDFRGRLYSLSAYLNPQGDDVCRGLLTFADKKPLGEQGDYWLCVHGANSIDEMDGIKVSKLTLNERVEFIYERHERLMNAASDPRTFDWWMELENPWQVLAFCFEYAAMQEWAYAGNRIEDFLSSLPVMMDGSCNGAQHYAAMFRDEVGGAAVNLMPAARPSDLYANVAGRLQDLVTEEAAAGDEMAILWNKSGLISRGLVKQPVMTHFYGSKAYGFRLQLANKLRQSVGKNALGTRTIEGRDGQPREVDATPAACAWLAERLSQALSQEVRCAHEGMLWLQDRSTRITSQNKAVEWTVPITNFFVRQEYVASEQKRIKTALFGSWCKLSYYLPTSKILPRKQRNGVSPNVIHSLDAAALMLMAESAVTQGVTHIAAVHDSFGTHAADTQVMRSVTRQAFVRLYSQDVAGELERQFMAQVGEVKEGEELVPVPAKGKLDLSGVYASDYFFA
jgi:DNA-directed RNA polymerase